MVLTCLFLPARACSLVVSGSGDWRFVDLVPAEAGKLQVGCTLS